MKISSKTELQQIVHYSLRRTCYQNSICEKIRAINNKIEQNKARYDSDRQTTTISALLSENVIKYKFLTSKDVLPDNEF